MAVTNPTHRDIKKSIPYMEQMSWDDTFEVLARLPLTLNPVTNSLERMTGIQGNGSMTLSYDADGQLTTIAKTIGATTYTKTLTWTDGKVTAILAWS